jgi:uncharacterized protein
MMKHFHWLLICLFSGTQFTLHGQDLKAGQECFPAKKMALVYDVADVIPADEETRLNDALVAFGDSTSNQITVVIVPDLCGMDKAQFATELGEFWGVGQSKEDNGIVFLVKPKTPESSGQVFIAVGRGLEAVIPDITAKQIIDNEVIPAFKQQGYLEGIESGCETLMELSRGEYNSDEYAAKHNKKKKGIGDAGAILLVFVIMLIVFAGKIFQVRRYASTNQMGFWAALAALNAVSRSHRGYYNNFSSGRGGFGGGGGGGFGGFGGGGFGGGGAGGSW